MAHDSRGGLLQRGKQQPNIGVQNNLYFPGIGRPDQRSLEQLDAEFTVTTAELVLIEREVNAIDEFD